MARIAGVNIPKDKCAWVALTYIHGIGKTSAYKILESLKIDTTTRVRDLTDAQAIAIREAVDKGFVVEGELRALVAKNIKLAMDQGSYVGLRHRRRLPVNGQNTQKNARTRKGKAVPIAGKKK